MEKSMQQVCKVRARPWAAEVGPNHWTEQGGCVIHSIPNPLTRLKQRHQSNFSFSNQRTCTYVINIHRITMVSLYLTTYFINSYFFVDSGGLIPLHPVLFSVCQCWRCNWGLALDKGKINLDVDYFVVLGPLWDLSLNCQSLHDVLGGGNAPDFGGGWGRVEMLANGYFGRAAMMSFNRLN